MAYMELLDVVRYMLRSVAVASCRECGHGAVQRNV